jgi:DNA-binding MarR family transcriptional regulator
VTTRKVAELAADLRLAIGRVARRIRRLYVDAAEGVSFLELAVLHRLQRTGPSAPGTIAGDEGVTAAAVAATLTSLETAGLVHRTRAPDDRRRVIVTITSAGRQTLETRESASIDRIETVLAGLTKGEREQLAAAVPLLERIASEL